MDNENTDISALTKEDRHHKINISDRIAALREKIKDRDLHAINIDEAENRKLSEYKIKQPEEKVSFKDLEDKARNEDLSAAPEARNTKHNEMANIKMREVLSAKKQNG